MAQLPAELNRIGEFVRLVASHNAQSDKTHDESEKEGEGATLARIVEIDMEVSHSLCWVLAFLLAVIPHAERDQEQSRHQEARHDHVGENAHVRTRVLRRQVDEKQKKKISEGNHGDSQADEGNRIAHPLAQFADAARLIRLHLWIFARHALLPPFFSLFRI